MSVCASFCILGRVDLLNTGQSVQIGEDVGAKELVGSSLALEKWFVNVADHKF